ncbi:MAG TPA: hypothetical protein VGH43_15845 [Jatrophihabitans sp.]
MDQPYEPPAPFAPPAQRTPPLNEVLATGRSTYPVPPMAPPVQYPPPPMVWQPGSGWAPYPAGPQPTARRRTIAVVSAVAVALLAIVTTLVISAAGPSRHTLSLPETAGDYVKLSTVSGSHITTIFGSNGTFGSIPTTDLTRARVGVYARGSQSAPSALFVGFSGSESPTIGQQLRSESSGQVTAEVLAGAGAALTPLTVDAGPLGGSLRCSSVQVNGLSATVGVWADGDTLGVVLLFDPVVRPSLEQTGDVTRDFRAQAEH